MFVCFFVFLFFCLLPSLGSGGVKVFPCYLRCDELDPLANPQMVAIFDKLKTEELSTGVSTLTGNKKHFMHLPLKRGNGG